MNIREGVRRLLVVVSAAAVIPAAMDSYSRLTAPESSAYWERQELAQCAQDKGGMRDPRLQFAVTKDSAVILSNGFYINPFEQFSTEPLEAAALAGSGKNENNSQLSDEQLLQIIHDAGWLTTKEQSHVLYTVCKQESDRFLTAANSIVTYRKVGMLKYNIQRGALEPIWMYVAFLLLLWGVFAVMVWIARGFKAK